MKRREIPWWAQVDWASLAKCAAIGLAGALLGLVASALMGGAAR